MDPWGTPHLIFQAVYRFDYKSFFTKEIGSYTCICKIFLNIPANSSHIVIQFTQSDYNCTLRCQESLVYYTVEKGPKILELHIQILRGVRKNMTHLVLTNHYRAYMYKFGFGMIGL